MKITDEAVEAAAIALHGYPEHWPALVPGAHELWRRNARLALEAALPYLAPAVPQPVDREALREQMVEAVSARLHITTDTICDGGKPHHLSADTSAVWEAVDAVLALLAGEQEQVESQQ